MVDDTKLTWVSQVLPLHNRTGLLNSDTLLTLFSPNKRLFEEFPCSLSKWYQLQITFFSEVFPEHSNKAKSPTGVESRSQEKEEMLPGSAWAPARTVPYVPGHSLSFSTAKGRGEDSVSASGTHSCLHPNSYIPLKTKQNKKSAPQNPDQELWRH